VLLLCELSVGEKVELAERGAVLTGAADAHDAFKLLASRDFDVVVVNPSTFGRGLDIVAVVKEGHENHRATLLRMYKQPPMTSQLLKPPRPKDKSQRWLRPPRPTDLLAARRRHRLTPFIVLAEGGGGEYAIVVAPPEASFMEDPERLPVVAAILFVDAAKLLRKAKPMA